MTGGGWAILAVVSLIAAGLLLWSGVRVRR